MKKFLTVLLALSVVFTYSFSSVGSVFAATTTASDVETELYGYISDYEQDLMGNIDRVVAKYIDNEKIDVTDNDYNKTVKKVAIKEGATAYAKDLIKEMKKIADKAIEEANKGTSVVIEDVKAAIDDVLKDASYEEYTKAEVSPVSSKVDGYVVYKSPYWMPVSGALEEGYFEVTGTLGGYYKMVPATTGNLWVWNAEKKYYQVAKQPTSPDAKYVTPVAVDKSTLHLGYAFTTSETKYYIYDEATKKYVEATGYAQPDVQYYTSKTIAAVDLTTIDDFAAALADTDYVAKAEAPKAEAYWTKAIEDTYPLTNYTADKGEYTYDGVSKLTAQEAVDAIKADALEKIADAKKALAKDKNYAAAVAAYKAAFDKIAIEIENLGIKTNEQVEDGAVDFDTALALEIAKLKAYAIGDFTKYIWDDLENPTGTNTANLVQDTNLDEFSSEIYEAKTGSKTVTIFGVTVKDVEKATRAEVLAVRAAYNKAILETVTAVEKAVEIKGGTAAEATAAVNECYNVDEHKVFAGTVAKAYGVSAKYDAVAARGEALKKAEKAGVKLYDDAKVDSVVKVALEAVYADMGANTVEEYFRNAINDVFDKNYITYKNALAELLVSGDYEYDKFIAAKEEAKAKFKAKVVTIGSNVTPEADKKYCRNYYAEAAVNAAGKTYGALYDDIKDDAHTALDEAQSYADIEAAMKAADEDLAKLMLASDKTVVEAARTAYCKAFADDIEAYKDILNDKVSDYDDALSEVKAAGEKLIKNAVTVDGVKAAYVEAKALFTTLKTDDELAKMKEDLEKQLKELPLASKVIAADAEKIEAARAALDAYKDTIGAEGYVLSESRLTAAEKALYTLERDALNLEIKALNDKLKKIDFAAADVAVKELLALKSEMSALAEKATAFNDKMDDKGYAELKVDVDAIVAGLNLAEGTVWDAEAEITISAIVKVLNSDKINTADVDAAFDAYKALTNRQKYKVDKETNYAVETIKAKLINATKALKIKTSTKLYTKFNKVRVNWKVVDGDTAAIDGYQVYKSTKAQKNYKYMGKTKKSYMDNKKNLKKGTRYYYKVRAYVEIDGQKYYSDWSNKGNRIYK